MTGPDDRSTPDADADANALEILASALKGFHFDTAEAAGPAPQALVDGAIWVHDWHTADAELAAMAFDSATEPQLAGSRSAGGLRQLVYESEEYEVHIEVHRRGNRLDLVGQVAPATAGRISITIGAATFDAPIDERGAFILRSLPQGTAIGRLQFADTTLAIGPIGL